MRKFTRKSADFQVHTKCDELKSEAEFNRSGFSKGAIFRGCAFALRFGYPGQVRSREDVRCWAGSPLLFLSACPPPHTPQHNSAPPALSGRSHSISIPHLPKLRMQLQWHKRGGDGWFSSAQLYDNEATGGQRQCA